MNIEFLYFLINVQLVENDKILTKYTLYKFRHALEHQPNAENKLYVQHVILKYLNDG